MNFSNMTLEDWVDLLHLSTSFEFETPHSLDDCALRLEQLATERGFFTYRRRLVEVDVHRFEGTRYNYDLRIRHRRSERPGYYTTASASGSLRATDNPDVTLVRGEAKLDSMMVIAMFAALVIAPAFVIFFKFPAFVWLLLFVAFIFVGYQLYRARKDAETLVMKALAAAEF